MSQYSLTALRHYYLCYSNLKYYKDFILLFVHPAPLSLHPALQEYKNKKRREFFNFLRFSSETRD